MQHGTLGEPQGGCIDIIDPSPQNLSIKLWPSISNIDNIDQELLKIAWNPIRNQQLDKQTPNSSRDGAPSHDLFANEAMLSAAFSRHAFGTSYGTVGKICDIIVLGLGNTHPVVAQVNVILVI